MDVRPATAEDVPAVLPMVADQAALHRAWDAAKFGYIDHPERMYENWLASRAVDPRAVFLVATADSGRIVGFLVATVERELPIYRLAEFGFIHDFFVDPAYRNEGAGRLLVTRAIEAFKSIGVSQVRGDTAAANEPARALLEGVGFRPSVVEMLIEM